MFHMPVKQRTTLDKDRYALYTIPIQLRHGASYDKKINKYNYETLWPDIHFV